MKLLFTQDALVNAGAERSHLEILSRFSEEVDVGFVYFYPKHDLREAYERAGIRLFFLDIPEGYHFILAVARLVRLIQQEKPDLLISSLWRADIITRIASFISGVPLVGTLVNDSYSPIAWTDKKGFKYKVVYWLDRWTAGIPVHWIANAHALADSHVKTLGIERSKISVVYRGRPVIDGNVIAREERPKQSQMEIAGRFVPRDDDTHLIESVSLGGSDLGAASPELDLGKQFSPVETASAAESFDIKSEISDSSLAVTSQIRNFISYGRLLERKGFQDAIRAFAKVYETYPDCTLTIFGDGTYRNQLETLIQELKLQNSVFLPGKIPNPMELLISNWNAHRTSDTCTERSRSIRHRTSFHCFLFPSWYEGFSGALVEAMMAGIPIIASDIPMNLEAIEDQKTALVFPVQDADRLYKQMIWALENQEEMQVLGQEAQKVAKERFDIEKIAWEYEAVLRKITAPRPSS